MRRLPVRFETPGRNRMAPGQGATLETRMRPVRLTLHPGLFADRDPAQGLRATEEEIDRERKAPSGENPLRQIGMKSTLHPPVQTAVTGDDSMVLPAPAHEGNRGQSTRILDQHDEIRLEPAKGRALREFDILGFAEFELP